MIEEKKYLGIDWGEKRIGLAMADGVTRLALPLQTVSSVKELLEVIEIEEIDALVLGKPMKMSGDEADSQVWLNFLEQLKEKFSGEIELVDERLTSLAGDALEGHKKEKASRDEIAAVLILQSYLDAYGRD